jgi:hypothetical protein
LRTFHDIPRPQGLTFISHLKRSVITCARKVTLSNIFPKKRLSRSTLILFTSIHFLLGPSFWARQHPHKNSPLDLLTCFSTTHDLHLHFLVFPIDHIICHGNQRSRIGVGRLTLSDGGRGIIMGLFGRFEPCLRFWALFACMGFLFWALVDYPLVFHFSLGEAYRRGCSCIFSPAHGLDSLALTTWTNSLRPLFSTNFVAASGPLTARPMDEHSIVGSFSAF